MGKTIAFIPVRGGSTSIPLKNIKPICGKPLLYWTARAAQNCPQIDEVVVSTDSKQIAETAQAMGLSKVTVVGRSRETASNTASTESAMLEYAQNNDFDTIALVQATSPLLTAEDLDEGFRQYRLPGVDSVLSVVEDKRFYWAPEQPVGEDGPLISRPVNYNVFNRPRRQDFDGYYMENGAFYITSRKRLIETRNRVSGAIALAVMPPDTSFEIDEPDDWSIIKALLKRRIKHEKTEDLSHIGMLLTDCDGCLTDAGMYYTEAGDELKKFNTRDGMAFSLLRERGIKVGIVTGEDSRCAERRAKKLKADYCVVGCKDKLAEVKRICADAGIGLENLLYIGDELNDLEVLEAAGYSCCPADACSEAKKKADRVLSTKGGKGVVREAARLLIDQGGIRIPRSAR